MSVLKTKYLNCLPGHFQGLGYFADELVNAKDNYQFFYTLCERFIPFIQDEMQLEFLRLEWIEKQDEFHRARTELTAKALEELQNAHKKIEERIKVIGLEHSSDLFKSLAIIEKLFSPQPGELYISYMQEIHDRLAGLCIILVDIGRSDLIEDLCEVDLSKYPQVRAYKFAPSYYELVQHEKQREWPYIDQAFIAWEYLTLANWCWSTTASFFDGKTLDVKSFSDIENSQKLLLLREFWHEMEMVKQRDYVSGNPLLMTKERFNPLIELIIQDIVSNFSKIEVSEFDKETFKEVKCPHELHLRYHEYTLYLDVLWFEGGFYRRFVIHNFNDNESSVSKFAKMITEAEPGTTLSLDEISARNMSVAKFFQRSKFPKSLIPAFFSKTTIMAVTLKDQTVILDEAPLVSLIEIRRDLYHLEELPSLITTENSPTIEGF